MHLGRMKAKGHEKIVNGCDSRTRYQILLAPTFNRLISFTCSPYSIHNQIVPSRFNRNLLAIVYSAGASFFMLLPDKPIALSPEQIADLNKKLSVMRHNVNNYLALIVAASELIRRKPEMATRLIENIAQQPDRIISEIRSFSDYFELFLTGKAPTPPSPPPSNPV